MAKKIEIKFNKELYSPKILQTTAKLYKDLAKFSFKDEGKYTKVVMENISSDVADVIKDEFCNYALFAMHNQK